MANVLTLGEIMLRLSTEPGSRIGQASHFQAHYGGGEANVAISLAHFGHHVSFASKVPDSALGEAVKRHLQGNGVSTDFLLTGGPRLGTYYMESGIGERSAKVIYDRAGSSFATMMETEWDIEQLFAGMDLFHISGITAALSDKWKDLTLKLVKKAKDSNVKISFDINYRGKLWSQQEAGETIRRIMPYVDYCSAGKMDALYLLDIPTYHGTDKELVYYYNEISRNYSNIQLIYSTNREIKSASSNQLQGTLWVGGNYYESQTHHISPIVDRVGGGDAFAAGILQGILNQSEPQEMINFATAASALKHTVYGDCNQFSKEEINEFLKSGSGKIIR